MKITAEAKKVLAKQGCALEDGYLRPKGSDDKSLDLTSGGGALYVAVNPNDKSTLAVGAYDRGKRYVALEAGCPGGKPYVAPLQLASEAAAQLFPKTLK